MGYQTCRKKLINYRSIHKYTWEQKLYIWYITSYFNCEAAISKILWKPRKDRQNTYFKTTDKRASTDYKAKWCERHCVLNKKWLHSLQTYPRRTMIFYEHFIGLTSHWILCISKQCLGQLLWYPTDLRIASEFLRTSVDQKKRKTTWRLVKNTTRLNRKQETSDKIWGCWLELETRLGNIAEKDWIN